MNKINIVSADSTLSRIVELEATRLELETVCSPTPLEGYPVYFVDLDSCGTAVLPAEATVILLSAQEQDELPTELISRATTLLAKPLLISELRFALTHLSQTAQHPVYLPERITAKRMRPKRETTGNRLIIDREKKTASLSGGDPVKLSDTEYQLLCLLYEHKNQPVSAEMAIPILGNTESNKYNVYICYLRRKLERGAIRLIRTVRGKGYMLQVK